MDDCIQSIKINCLPCFEIVLRSFNKQQFRQNVYEHFFYPLRNISECIREEDIKKIYNCVIENKSGDAETAFQEHSMRTVFYMHLESLSVRK